MPIEARANESASLPQGDLDVVVPFYGRSDLVGRCLRSLDACLSDPTQALTIVDDGSPPAERRAVDALLDGYPRPVRVVTHARNHGFRAAATTGVAAGRAERVLLVNTDTVLTPGFDRKLLESLRADPDCRAVGPVSGHPTDLFQYDPACRGLVPEPDDTGAGIGRRFEALATHAVPATRSVPYLTAMCLLFDRRTFEEVGGFSESYRHGYFEDLDLCCKIRARGQSLGLRVDCFVWHQGHATYATLWNWLRGRRIRRNQALFNRRWGHLPEHAALEALVAEAGRRPPS